MADDAKGQAPTDSGQEPQTDQQGAAGAQGQEPERFDAEYVKQLRREAAEYRKKLRDLEQTVKQHEEAKLSESERLQKRLAELEREQANYQRERQEHTVRYEVMLAAGKLGIVDPEAAYRLLDLSALEFDDEGNPKNVEKALKDLVARRNYLVGQAQSGSPTNPPRGQQAQLTMDDVRKMGAEEVNRRWDEVQRVLAEARGK